MELEWHSVDIKLPDEQKEVLAEDSRRNLWLVAHNGKYWFDTWCFEPVDNILWWTHIPQRVR